MYENVQYGHATRRLARDKPNCEAVGYGGLNLLVSNQGDCVRLLTGNEVGSIPTLAAKVKEFDITKSEYQTCIRIRLSIAAFAYEFDNVSIISDAEFDRLCLDVDVSIKTSRPDLDEWFSKSFVRSTGMWIGMHPEIEKIKSLYKMYWK